MLADDRRAPDGEVIGGDRGSIGIAVEHDGRANGIPGSRDRSQREAMGARHPVRVAIDLAPERAPVEPAHGVREGEGELLPIERGELGSRDERLEPVVLRTAIGGDEIDLIDPIANPGDEPQGIRPAVAHKDVDGHRLLPGAAGRRRIGAIGGAEEKGTGKDETRSEEPRHRERPQGPGG